MSSPQPVYLTDDQRVALDMAVRLLEAVNRAHDLGWHSITVKRLMAAAEGVKNAMPPDPATAPPSAFGARARRRYVSREDDTR